MFNRRSIACPRCGFLCLKQLQHCYRCNQSTSNPARNSVGIIIIAALAVMMAVLAYVSIGKGVVPSTLSPDTSWHDVIVGAVGGLLVHGKDDRPKTVIRGVALSPERSARDEPHSCPLLVTADNALERGMRTTS